MCMCVYVYCEQERISASQMSKVMTQIYQKMSYPFRKKRLLVLLKNLKACMAKSSVLHRDPVGRPREENEVAQ